jgi:hypothetical protein
MKFFFITIFVMIFQQVLKQKIHDNYPYFRINLVFFFKYSGVHTIYTYMNKLMYCV